MERRAWREGFRRVAGVDEVGRGALFGPVAAAAVILDPQHRIRGLNDSKQLEPEERERLAVEIRRHALAVSVAAVDAARIDQVNIYQASRLAMRRAVEGLVPQPDYVLVDAVRLDLSLPQRAILQGDARSISIAAASIIAKVERDRWMRLWHDVFPDYNLAGHKGYTTAEHLGALKRCGTTALHRRSFDPVASQCLYPDDRPAENLELFAE